MEEKIINENQVSPDAPKYMAEALFLAESYTQMLKFRDALKKRIAGSWIYTIDMAISDLDSITVSYESERVQSSNISKPTERIALKLTDEYMARKQAEMDAEKAAIVRELEYVSWKIEVVESAVLERMDHELQDMFTLQFKGQKTYKQTEDILRRKRKRKVYSDKILKQRQDIIKMLIRELLLRSGSEEDALFMEMLTQEARQEADDHTGEDQEG